MESTTIVILFFIVSGVICNVWPFELSVDKASNPKAYSQTDHSQAPIHSHDQPSSQGHDSHEDNHGPSTNYNCEKYTTGPDCTDLPLYNCSWCFLEIFKFPRCDSYNRLLKKGCGEDLIYNDYYEYQTRVIDLNDPNPIPDVRLTLMLTGVTKSGSIKNYSIMVNWTQPPMDIYVLLDVSSSMEDDKANVVGLANQLFSFIQTLTNNYTIGLGIFSDRVDAFTYKNVLNLTHDISLFPPAVANAPIEGGDDYPEDAGTAIYESLICKEQIGWRETVRKFLMVLTDDTFHTANDGYMDTLNASAIDFDGFCHLDGSGVYTENLIQDYPTLSQIALLLNDASINSIFGIVNGPDFYSNLMPLISPAAYGILSSDSSNLIQLVNTTYGRVYSFSGGHGV